MKAQEFLEQHQITIDTIVDARKERLEAEPSWAMLQTAELIATAKGRRCKLWRPLQDDQTEILQDVIGRSGNLRAPTIKMGERFLVGFNEEMYRDYLELA